MAEAGNCERNLIFHYDGLETMFREHLPKCDYKTDVVMVFAHYLLTEVLNFECVQVDNDSSHDTEKSKYKPNTALLGDSWKRGYNSYKMFYKNKMEIRLLTCQKSQRDVVLYFSKENGNRFNVSQSISLKNYIPDAFLKSNDLSLIDNLHQLNDTLLKYFGANDKMKNKQQLVMHTMQDNVWEWKSMRNDPKIVDDNDSWYAPIKNIRDDARPGCYLNKDKNINKEIGNFYLQDNTHNSETELNKLDPNIINEPIYYMEEAPDGPPDQSYVN